MQNYRLILVLCVAGVILSVAVLNGYAQQNKLPVSPLDSAAAAMEVEVREASVNGWAKVSTGQISDEELGRMAQEAMESLGLTDFRLKAYRTDRQRLVRAEAATDSLRAVVAAEALNIKGSMPEQDSEGVYLVVNIESKVSNANETEAWAAKIKQIFSRFGGVPRISTCLTGWLDGKLREDEWEHRLYKGFAAAGATRVEAFSYVNFASYTGYTPAIHDSIKVGKGRMNLNIAMRYSPNDDRTYVVIGSPIITQDY